MLARALALGQLLGRAFCQKTKLLEFRSEMFVVYSIAPIAVPVLGLPQLLTSHPPLILSLPSHPIPSHPIQPPSILIPHSPSIPFLKPPTHPPLSTQPPFFFFYAQDEFGGSCHNPLRLDFSTFDFFYYGGKAGAEMYMEKGRGKNGKEAFKRERDVDF